MFYESEWLIASCTQGAYLPYPEGWRRAVVLLNSQTFGLANYSTWIFWLTYDPRHNFNCELPNRSTYRETPRSVLQPGKWTWQRDFGKIEFGFDEEALFAKMPVGYTYDILMEYHPELEVQFPKPFRRIAWDVPCRQIEECSVYWVHPEENRLLYFSELNVLAGTKDHFLDVPDAIEEYMYRQIELYEEGAWEEQDFQFNCDFYGPDVKDCPGLEEKCFNMTKYVAQYLPLCSRWKGAK